jgi:hypothetical protein
MIPGDVARAGALVRVPPERAFDLFHPPTSTNGGGAARPTACASGRC